jgi:hypothetical protein
MALALFLSRLLKRKLFIGIVWERPHPAVTLPDRSGTPARHVGATVP